MRGFSAGMAEAIREMREMTPEQWEERQRKMEADILRVRIEMRKLYAAQSVEINRNRHRRYYG